MINTTLVLNYLAPVSPCYNYELISLWYPFLDDNIKTLLFHACVTQHNGDIICLCETFLRSSIQNGDDRIKIDGYNLIRPYHPSDSKKEEFVFIIKSIYLLLNDMIFALRLLLSYKKLLTKWEIFFNLFLPLAKPKPRWTWKLLPKFWYSS